MSEPVVLRPPRSAYKQTGRLLVLPAWLVLVNGLHERWWLVAILVALGLLSVLTLVLDVTRSRVVLTEDSVELHRWWRRTVVVPLEGVVGLAAQVAETTMKRGATPRRVVPSRLVLRSADGDTGIRLDERHWGDTVIATVAEHAGVERLSWVVTPRELGHRVPGTVGPIERLPFAVKVLLFVLAVAVFLGVGIPITIALER